MKEPIRGAGDVMKKIRRPAARIAAAALVALAGCVPTTRITIERLAPPAADVKGIRTLAVLRFSAPSGEGAYADAARARLIGVLANTGRYRVMKEEQVDKVLARAGITFSYPPGEAITRRIGAALKVDAIVCGAIKSYTFDEENRLVRVRENVWTGDYERDRHGVPVSDRGPDGEDVPRKTYRRQRVEKNRLKRSASLQIHYLMSDASRGNAVWSDSESESESWEGTGADEIARMPGREVIFDLLLDATTKEFVKNIAPHPIEEERVLETGMFHVTNLGVELAKNNLWDEAVEKWLQAGKAAPEEAPAFYNLGVAFERKGLFDLAYKAYQNALARNPKSKRYVDAIAHIQKLIKDLE